MTSRAVYCLANGEIVCVSPCTNEEPDGEPYVPPAGCGYVDVTVCECCSDLKQRAFDPATIVSGSVIAIEDAACKKRGKLLVSAMGSPVLTHQFTVEVQAYDGDGVEEETNEQCQVVIRWGADTLSDATVTLVAGYETHSIVVPETRPVVGGNQQPYGMTVSVRPLATQRYGSHFRIDVEG